MAKACLYFSLKNGRLRTGWRIADITNDGGVYLVCSIMD